MIIVQSGRFVGGSQSGESSRVQGYLVEGSGPEVPPTGARFSTGEDAALLVGPSSPPSGAVTVTAGVTDIGAVHHSNPAGTTYWLSPGVHTPGLGSPTAFSQVQVEVGNTYIGAPGAILDGAGVCRTAFARADAGTGATIKTLEIRNFVPLQEQYMMNPDGLSGWRFEGLNIHDNGTVGTPINCGSNSVILNCWLHDNGQYGLATYTPPASNGAVNAVTNVDISYCEINGNGRWQDEYATGGLGPLGSGAPSGAGRNGGMKFWDTNGIQVDHCWIHHNEYTAIWADTNNVNMTVEDNYINDNYGVGFFYEISYNFGVRRNTFLRNAIFAGMNKAAYGDNFPFPAVYISEAGGDSTVNATWANSYIGGDLASDGNTFIDNWCEIAVWENPDRFCNSPNNTSHKIWKPLHTVSATIASLAICNIPATKTMVLACTNGSPTFTWVSGNTFEAFSTLNRSSDEGRPVSGTGIPGGTKIWEPTSDEPIDGPGTTSRGLYAATVAPGAAVTGGRFTANFTGTTGNVTVTVAAGSINAAPAYSACRWPTKNVKVKNNLFVVDADVVKALWPSITVPGNVQIGKVALFSVPGTNPSWSPYMGDVIQQAVTFNQGNVWSNNTYIGSHYWMPFETAVKTWTQWRAAPYNQDAGSTGPPPTIPGVPTIGTAVAGAGSADVAFTPSASGDPATSFTATSSPGGLTASGAASPLTVTGLTNGQAYTFTVTATNATGTSGASAASNSVTPSAAPIEMLRQTARDQESTLEWIGLTNCTVALTTAQFYAGAQSVEATVTADGQAVIQLKTPWVTVTPGTVYTISARIRFAQTRFPAFMIRYSNGAGNDFLGDFQANPTPTANAWTLTSIGGAAPTGAANARIELASFSMLAGEKFWIDSVSLTRPS